jgi:histone H3
MSQNHADFRITPEALGALQESVESFVVSWFEDVNLCAIHAGRVTIQGVDVELVKRTRVEKDH